MGDALFARKGPSLLLNKSLGEGGQFVGDPQDLDATAAGAYVLMVYLDRKLSVVLRNGALCGTLTRGIYLYAGNANGPGGLKARLSRHFGKAKKPHWHVDHVTVKAAQISALVFPDADECDLIARLLDTGQVTVPVPGFGSSDCRVCPSHFLKWGDLD